VEAWRSGPEGSLGHTPDMPRSPAGPDRLLLAYLLAACAVVTLVPFRFTWPEAVRVRWASPPFDAVTNVLLFLPIGFVWPAGTSGGRRLRVLRVWVLASAVSAAFETAQVFLPGRYPSPVDVMTNGVGAGLGACLRTVADRAFAPGVVRGLGLDLPLMNLVYLLVPLLWLEALAVHAAGGGLWLGPLLGLCGALVLASVWRHRLAASGLPAGVLGAAVGGWFLTGSFAAVPAMPLSVAAAALVLSGLGGVAVAAAPDPPRERRFELPTLRVVAPVYAVYLALAVAGPWPWALEPWRASLGLADIGDLPGLPSLLRLVRHIAGLTLLGYMVAEWRGRRGAARRSVSAATALACLAAAGVAEALLGIVGGRVASLLRLALAVAAALFGAFLYGVQLRLVRALLEPPRP
jgi:VanZ family protein